MKRKVITAALYLFSICFLCCSDDEKTEPQSLKVTLNGEEVRFKEIKARQTGESASIEGVPYAGKLLTITGTINDEESIVIEVLDWAQQTVVLAGLNSKTYSNIIGEDSDNESDCVDEGKCDGFEITYQSAESIYRASYRVDVNGHVTITNNWDGAYSAELSNESQTSSVTVTGTFEKLPVSLVGIR